MRYRKLRIAWSLGWGVLTVLLVALWVRSYFACDVLSGNGTASYCILASDRGLVMLTSVPNVTTLLQNTGWELISQDGHVGDESRWRISYADYVIGTEIDVPDWMFVFVTGFVAAGPWLLRRFRITTLLIVTAAIALALGTIARKKENTFLRSAIPPFTHSTQEMLA